VFLGEVMTYLQFTEFRNHSKEYFEKIEKGEAFIIIRKGRPVAKILPFIQKTQGWKRDVSRIKLRKTNKTTTDYIIEERSEK